MVNVVKVHHLPMEQGCNLQVFEAFQTYLQEFRYVCMKSFLAAKSKDLSCCRNQKFDLSPSYHGSKAWSTYFGLFFVDF